MPPIPYGPGKKRIFQLLRKASAGRSFAMLFAMGLCVAAAFVLRGVAFESVRVSDGSMRPEIKVDQRVWICKLPICTDRAPLSAPVLAESRGGDRLLRWKLGAPGMDLTFGPQGRVRFQDQSWTWRREHTIIDEQRLYIPRQGDSLKLDSLEPMAFDFATKLFRKQWPSRQTWVIVSLWNGNAPLPLSEVGRASIGNRPVAQSEVAGLPWQELRLLEMQLQRLEASSSPIRFRRRLYADSVEIKSFRVQEDCWYLACSRGSLCTDSRDEGFFVRSDLVGSPLPIASLSPRSPIPWDKAQHP